MSTSVGSVAAGRDASGDLQLPVAVHLMLNLPLRGI
jgi:hypothetical protein